MTKIVPLPVPTTDANSAQDNEPTAWAQLTLAELLASLFEGSKHFNICVLHNLIPALNEVRYRIGLPKHEGKGPTRAALDALHCRNYDEMSKPVRDGIKQAVWHACGLTEEVGQAAFGAHWERVKALDVVPVKQEKSVLVEGKRGRVLRLLSPVGWVALMTLGLGVVFAVSYSIGKDRGREEARLRPWLYQQYGGELVAPLEPAPVVRVAPQPEQQMQPSK